MLSLLVFCVALANLAEGSVGGGDGVDQAGFASRTGNSHEAIDQMVKETFLEARHSMSAAEFAAGHAALRGLSLSRAEIDDVVDKLGSDNADRDALGRILDAAAALKDRLSSCPSTAGQSVGEFVRRGQSVESSLHRLEYLLQNWRCPDQEQSHQLQEDDGVSKYLSQIKRLIRENPSGAAQTALGLLHGAGWLHRDLMPVAQMVAGYLASAPEYAEYAAGFLEWGEKFAATESGRRVVRVLPKLMKADADEALEIFKHEADFNQEVFFSLMANGDLAENFLKKIARQLIQGVQYCQKLLGDDLKFALLNSLFISNNIPPLDRRNLLKSSVDTFERLTRRYTPAFVSTESDYYSTVRAVLDEIEREYFRLEDLSRLTDEEMENALGKFLEDNFVDPARDAWLANRQVTTGSGSWCSAELSCLYARAHRGRGRIVRWIAGAFESTLKYFWTSSHSAAEDGVDAAAIDAAAEHGWNGDGGSGCERFRPAPEKKAGDCDVFTLYREKKLMNIRYSHNEL